MSSPDEKKPPQSKTVQVCAMIFLAIGVGVFQAMAPHWFPPQRGNGIDWNRTLWSGVAGAVCASVGALVGKLIDRMRQ